MRKFFALALAVAMVLSLASVSFAADEVAVQTKGESVIALTPFFKYNSDKDKLEDKQAQYGKSYYAMIFEGKTTTYSCADEDVEPADAVTYAPIKDYEQVEKLKVKAEFEMGEDLVESVSIVKKSFKDDGLNQAAIIAKLPVKNTTVTPTIVSEAITGWTVNNAVAVSDGFAEGYYYFVEVKTKADRVTGDADVIGTFEFNRKAKDDVAKIDDCEVDFEFNLWYEKNYLGGDDYNTSFTVDGSEAIELKWDDLYVLKFESDDEVEFEFGFQDNNEGLFTVDASGQGKMVVDYNTKANEAICAANEGVKMFFVNFNGAKFNRTGTFEYEMEDMVAAYQIVDDKLVEIAGLELDGETATFSTRTLGNYVFATAELVNPVVEAPVVEAPAAVTNPSTGA